MRTAIVIFDAFNEIDAFVALNILNRVQRPGWHAHLCAPEPTATSMNGVTVQALEPLESAAAADAVIVGSGRRTRELIDDPALCAQLRFDPARQWIGSQCSGALWLARLGLLADRRACTDAKTRPMLQAEGVVVADAPFLARDRMASAGGCLSSVYLATWLICRGADRDSARQALGYVAPVGEAEAFIAHALAVVEPFLADR